MKALIVIAHGSRRAESNAEIRQMVDRIRELVAGHYDHISHCFLEVCAPSLNDAVADCVARGASEVTVYPFFLNSGNHVQRDIPDMVSGLNAQYRSCDIQLLPHFGKAVDIAALIADHIQQ